MKHTMLTRLGAAGLAAATITTGLAFGPAAANAAASTNALNLHSSSYVWGNNPTLAAGQARTGELFGMTLVNPNSAGLSGAAKFEFKAPSGTTFPKAEVRWGNRYGGTGTWTRGTYGSSVCALSSGNTVLICDIASMGVVGTNGAGNQLGSLTLWTDLRANSPLQEYGKISDGSFKILSGAYDNSFSRVISYTTSGTQPLGAQVVATDLHARTADLSGYGAPNATMILNDTISVPVGADGKWSYTITGLKLGKNDIKIEQYEGENNKTGETSVVADLAVAPIDAHSTFATGDNTKPMTISGTAQAGANVEIWQGTTKLQTVPAAAVTGAFIADIAAPNAGGVQSYTLKQVIDGETAADTATVTADFGAQVSIVTPANDMIHDGGALRFQGRGVAGGKVELREQGKQGVIGTADVLANGIWTIDAANIPGKKATYVATQTGKGNNVTTSAVTLNPDGNVTAPVVSPIAEGSNIVSGSGATPGSTIIVKDKDGTELGRDTVDEHGNWSVTVPPTLGPGKHDLDVVTVQDGETSDPTHIAVDFGASVHGLTPTIDVPVKDAKPTFTGTGQPGATVVIAGTRATVATTTVKADGTWSVQSDLELPAGEYVVSTTQTTGIGVKSVDQLHFKRQNDAPVATPVKLLTPATGTTVNTKRPTFTGTGHAGATVEIRGVRATVATTTVGADGKWSVTSPVDLPNGDYRLFAEQTPQNGAAKSIDETTIKVAYRASADVVVTGPTDTVATPVGPVTFTGTGDAGATIAIEGTTAQVASGIVNADGTFSITSTINFPVGDYRLVAKQVAQNGEMKQSASFLIKVRG